jgi:lipopolysaccharide export system protein LptA
MMRLPHIADRLLCVCLALALGSLAQARESDRQKPMDVESDHSQTSTAAMGATHLWGNVHATQGTLDMTADDAMLSQNKDGLSRVVLKGNPVHLKQDDENGDPMTATSQDLDYDLVKKIAVLTGNVIITQPRGVMHGERVVYDVGNSQITSGGDGSRVRMHIEPKPATAASDKPKKDKKDKKAGKPSAAPAGEKTPANSEKKAATSDGENKGGQP